jgi:hypothetical protein
MSESEPSGYQDSPDTTDPGKTETSAGSGSDATLTTDDEAQRDDAVERPGNEPD